MHQPSSAELSPLARLVRSAAFPGLLLVACAGLAIAIANSPWSAAWDHLWHTELAVRLGGVSVSHTLAHWINDGLMVLFFFFVGLEIKHEVLDGQLRSVRQAALPVAAAIGGMVVPAGLYVLTVSFDGTPSARIGWGIPMATDIAFALGILALLGNRVPPALKVFLASLAIADDLGAVLVIAIFYTEQIAWGFLAAGAGVVTLSWLSNRLGVRRTWPYVVYGLVLWALFLSSGVHATIAGVLLALTVPARRALDETWFARRGRELLDEFERVGKPDPLTHPEQLHVLHELQRHATDVQAPLQRMVHGLHPLIAHFVVPVFALANAGVDLRGGVLGEALRSPVTWGVVLGLAVGKLLGIGFGSLLAEKLHLGRLPQGVGNGHVFGGAALSGIGFTVSLLIVGLAFQNERLQAEATVGVLLSAVLASALGWLVFRFAAKVFGQTDAALPRTLSEPVTERDHMLGRPDAPLTLVEYLDYECPFCAKATSLAVDIRNHFGDRLRYVARHLPLDDVHPHARLAAQAAEAAGEQGKFWEMHNHLFQHQDQLEYDDLVGYAADLDLDVEQFVRDLDRDDLCQRVQHDVETAHDSGARGTPTFFVGTTRHVGAYDASNLIAELERDGDR
jgi:Na+/H+ antiporter NhaA